MMTIRPHADIGKPSNVIGPKTRPVKNAVNIFTVVIYNLQAQQVKLP